MIKHGPGVVDRRTLIGGAAMLSAASWSGLLSPAMAEAPALKSLPRPPAITPDERRQRIARAQEAMAAQGIGAVLIEPGSSLAYFTGVRWHRSERLTAAILPAQGDVIIVTPFFEAPSVRETLAVPADLRVWQEDESPAALVGAAIRERDPAGKRIAIEETVRFFASDGLARAMPSVAVVSADPVIRPLRMRKSAAEIALMQAASDITVAAYRWTHPRIREGMTPGKIGAVMNAATQALGGDPGFALVLLGEASAYPHGSDKPQAVREGEVVLMDCGCSVEGYQSDISRSFVYGKATAEQRRVWEQVAEGQQVARGAARIGAAAGSVDDAVRARYERWGYGPGYKLPGLSHRTGHGIGLDGHEPVNLVHGEATLLAAGMCFSNEPGLYLPGKFGIRLEDCFHMTEAGPKWFSTPSTSVDMPVG